MLTSNIYLKKLCKQYGLFDKSLEIVEAVFNNVISYDTTRYFFRANLRYACENILSPCL